MSGIVGILNLDGRAVDRELFEGMTASLAFRGPDAQRTWIDGPVAFGQTLLRTTFEAQHEIQPHTLDGHVWITADARIDAREDLVRDLGLPRSVLARPDCELILHAYARWGESCVDHLLGDFAFAIWDARLRKLFCARDHFGIRPFFYAHVGDTLVFSNTLNCVRLHPAVSDELNELAIGDFLVFDYNQDPATTTFRDIGRLPPAHVLVVTVGRTFVRRYWSLPEGERIRYPRTRDYVDHFRSLLAVATADRLRTGCIALMMSGGLDSTAVAMAAQKAGQAALLKAYTIVFDSLIPDDERYFAGLVAGRLRIPVEFITADHVQPFAGDLPIHTPEPVHEPGWGFLVEYRRRITAENVVVLGGAGADPLLSVSPLTNWAAICAVPWFATLVNFVRYTCEHRTIPRFRLRSTLLSFFGKSAVTQTEVPRWLDPEFAVRCNAAQRVRVQACQPRGDELRPLARRSLRSPYWTWQFEMDDAAWTGVRLEYRQPYFDVRLVRYLLAIPELPYSMDKHLLRLMLRGEIPDPVCFRPKTPLRMDPLETGFLRYGLNMTALGRPHWRLSQFIDCRQIPSFFEQSSAGRLGAISKVISLNIWLKSQEEERTNGTYRQCIGSYPIQFAQVDGLR